MTDQVVDSIAAGSDKAAAKPKTKVRAPAEAAQVLQAILETGNLRYWIIFSWAVALATAVGPWLAAGWFALTMAAGYVRGQVEKHVVARTGSKYAPVFVWVAFLTTFAWATAPALAWFQGGPMGPALAVALLCSGYVMVFTQMRTAPREAFVISAPYTLTALVLVATLWGQPGFWSLLAVAPVLGSALLVKVIITMMKEAKIQSFQDYQTHLIEELETARDRADAASEAKSNFLGVISHELRTPMNGVLGAAQLMSATRLDTTQRDYLSIIRNSGDNLLGLLNDILDMTKIEAGKMTFEAVEVDMQDLHRRITGPFTAQAEAKGLDLVTTFDGEVPAVVRGDPLRVCQVVQNLLSNAVKFTQEGQVRYRLSGRRVADDRVAFDFTIVDSGPGKGSTFVFSVDAEVLEWRAAAEVKPLVADCGEGRCLSVLVVEDHPVNRMILEAWLSSSGHTATTAENGQLALDVCADQRFDLIVMDVNMPVMDGLTATRRLRGDGGPNAETPVVVLSASARTEDHHAGLAAGADAYLNKPIDFAALAEVVGRVHGGRAAVRALAEPLAA